jgi:uncharacterized protein YecE (DUF72 family)
MKLWVGTSGFSYKEWKGTFYPEDLAATKMLHYYGTQLSSVEINNTFYRFPKKSVLESWAEQVPAEFRFVLKAPKKITHFKRLKDAEEELSYLCDAAAVLEKKLGALLFQLPPNLQVDLERLKMFLGWLPAKIPAAFEFRHASWMDESVFAALRDHNCALCLSDSDDAITPELVKTADFGYLRLRRVHYSASDLLQWKQEIAATKWKHAFVFFKHEDGAVGPKLAADFA